MIDQKLNVRSQFIKEIRGQNSLLWKQSSSLIFCSQIINKLNSLISLIIRFYKTIFFKKLHAFIHEETQKLETKVPIRKWEYIKINIVHK